MVKGVSRPSRPGRTQLFLLIFLIPTLNKLFHNVKDNQKQFYHIWVYLAYSRILSNRVSLKRSSKCTSDVLTKVNWTPIVKNSILLSQDPKNTSNGTKDSIKLWRIINSSSPPPHPIYPKGLRAESARAVTGRQCPHSGVGGNFLVRLLTKSQF